MASDLKQYLDQAGELPTDAVLGWIVMFTIADMKGVKRDDLTAMFDALGLDKSKLPPEIKPIDAFKRATTECKVDHTQVNGQTVSYFPRDVSSNSHYIERHIVREVKDSSRRKLEHCKAIEITFHRPSIGKDKKRRPGSERLKLIPVLDNIPLGEREMVTDLIALTNTRYEEYADYLDSQKIRGVVRDYVKFLNAIELKGGVYFVHQIRDDELQRLNQLVEKLPGGCSMYRMPLIDLPSARVMVIENFEREAKDALDAVVKQCATLKATRNKITPAAYAKVKGEFDGVMNQANEYLCTLGINQDVTAAALEMALESLHDLSITMLNGDS